MTDGKSTDNIAASGDANRLLVNIAASGDANRLPVNKRTWFWPADGRCTGCRTVLPLFSVAAADGWFCMPCLLRGRASASLSSKPTELPVKLSPDFFLNGYSRRGMQPSDLSRSGRKRAKQRAIDCRRLIDPADRWPIAAWMVVRQPSTVDSTFRNTAIGKQAVDRFVAAVKSLRLAFTNDNRCGRCDVSLIVIGFRRTEVGSSLATSSACSVRIHTDFCLRCFLQELTNELRKPAIIMNDAAGQPLSPSAIAARLSGDYFGRWRWSMVVSSGLPPPDSVAPRFLPATDTNNNIATDYVAAKAVDVANIVRLRLDSEGYGGSIRTSDAMARSIMDLSLAAVGFGTSSDRLADGYSAIDLADRSGKIPVCSRHLWRDERTPNRMMPVGRSVLTGADLHDGLVSSTGSATRAEAYRARQAAAVLVKTFPSNRCVPLWRTSADVAAVRPDVIVIGRWPSLMSSSSSSSSSKSSSSSSKSSSSGPSDLKTGVCSCRPPSIPTVVNANEISSDWMADVVRLIKSGWRRLTIAIQAQNNPVLTAVFGELRLLVIPTASTIVFRSSWMQTVRHRSDDDSVDDPKLLTTVAVAVIDKHPSSTDSSSKTDDDPVWPPAANGIRTLLARPLGRSLVDLLQPAPYGMYAFDDDVLTIAIDGTWHINGPNSDRQIPPPVHFVARLLVGLCRSRLSMYGSDLTNKILVAACSSRPTEQDLTDVLRLAAGFAAVLSSKPSSSSADAKTDQPKSEPIDPSKPSKSAVRLAETRRNRRLRSARRREMQLAPPTRLRYAFALLTVIVFAAVCYLFYYAAF